MDQDRAMGDGLEHGGPAPQEAADGAEALIARLGLRPHPEGGWYRELHRSATTVRRDDDGNRRSSLTLIAYLLRQGERSRWHRVRGSDEIWVHAAGAPLDLWALPPEGGEAQRLGLGSLTADAAASPATRQGADGPAAVVAGAGGSTTKTSGDAEDRDEAARVIPAEWWQAARSRGAWSLVHCAVGPGFDFVDFEILADLPAVLHPAGARLDLL